MTNKLPEITITPQAERAGRLLEVPHDFTPVRDILPVTSKRAQHVYQLIRDEEERAREAGMTVEELRHYQDLLLKKF